MNRNRARALLFAIAALHGSLDVQALTIGSEAPPLDIAHWMKGEEVARFAAGQVYVLEFWATWCAPCVANMEHLSQVQERYATRGVHVIGLSDEPLQTTVAFLCKRHGEQEPQLERTRYALATDPDRSVHEAYFEAAGLRGIPAVFLIGKDGKVEWIGHPAEMDAVLEAVVTDRWNRAEHRAKALAELEAQGAFREANARFMDALEKERWEDALAALDVLVTSPDDGDLYVPAVAGILLSRLKDAERGYALRPDASRPSTGTTTPGCSTRWRGSSRETPSSRSRRSAATWTSPSDTPGAPSSSTPSTTTTRCSLASTRSAGSSSRQSRCNSEPLPFSKPSDRRSCPTSWRGSKPSCRSCASSSKAIEPCGSDPLSRGRCLFTIRLARASTSPWGRPEFKMSP